jgi:flagellar biosynthesis/type III secretory pathway M-ring protein FliF/YscJ
MDVWIWIVIAVAAVIVLGLIVFAMRRARERRLEAKRQEAFELRQQAESKVLRAEHRTSVADELAERARKERREADLVAQRADEVDPDVD